MKRLKIIILISLCSLFFLDNLMADDESNTKYQLVGHFIQVDFEKRTAEFSEASNEESKDKQNSADVKTEEKSEEHSKDEALDKKAVKVVEPVTKEAEQKTDEQQS